MFRANGPRTHGKQSQHKQHNSSLAGERINYCRGCESCTSLVTLWPYVCADRVLVPATVYPQYVIRYVSKWHKELKPNLAKLMRDLAVLKRAGHLLPWRKAAREYPREGGTR